MRYRDRDGMGWEVGREWGLRARDLNVSGAKGTERAVG